MTRIDYLASPTGPRRQPERLDTRRRWRPLTANVLRRAIPLHVRRPVLDFVLEHLDGRGASSTLSYSSTGQDMILRHVIGPGAISGFYVDVGAWQPKLGSNTYALYRRGWSGITIEPRRGSTDDFRRHRRRDIHLELGIAPEPGTLTYKVARSDHSSVNSFNAQHIEHIGVEIVDEYPVKVDRLDEVLSRWLPSGQTMDFLAIDTEGSDLGVLQSNDWQRFRPAVVLVEDSDEEPCRFLRDIGYIELAMVPILGDIRDHLFVDPARSLYRDL